MGTDVTILSFSAWPLQWPLDPVELPVAGLGGTAQCFVSQQPVLIMNSEGQSAMVRPYVTEAIANLWGRDVLQLGGYGLGRIFDGDHCDEGRKCPMPPLRWLVDKPTWENQWPLPEEKLVALRELVQEQLDQGHLEFSTSPWNTPVFCIKKKSGKWRLLQDLWKINAVMESMESHETGSAQFVELRAAVMAFE
ncbi:hypothetical protein DUI87_00987 [Hirundo rustica rustica]|uniref:Peptidase A2 domain-containing protein n=1 Tax=Hirundo rustica rustica TaxID=333673 RepID=A0A3M0L522_HIRRU|nr:hypothetical protein DUI87_00987 [Hirundo rustica rustica]